MYLYFYFLLQFSNVLGILGGHNLKVVKIVQIALICLSILLLFSCQVMSDSAIPWTAAHQASLSITNSQSLPRIMSIESVMPSNHLILCHHLLLLPSIFPIIRVFSNESAVHSQFPTNFVLALSFSGDRYRYMIGRQLDR